MKRYLSILTIFFSLSCKNSTNKEDHLPIDTLKINTDTSLNQNVSVEDWKEKGKKLRDTNYQYLKQLLDKILINVELHKDDNFYSGNIETSVFHFKNMNAAFQFGNIFSADRKHLLVKRFINQYDGLETSLFSDIYIFKDNKFKKIISDTAEIGYSEDTLQDINLDGYKDYMISQYSGAGCCPRDSRIAYLYNAKNGNFETVGFFNLEFDNKNKLIYEMDYGSPGLVSLEKSKWNGLSKIKIESISPTHFQNRIDSFEKPYTYTKTLYPSEKALIIKEVPKEYKKLQHFEYFTGYQN